MILDRELLEKIYGRIDIDEDTLCFHYLGGDNGQNYGRMWTRGKNHSVHRLMQEIFHGPLPPDKEVHHTCGVRNCCNIAHLALVSHRDKVFAAAVSTTVATPVLNHGQLADWKVHGDSIVATQPSAAIRG